MAILDTKVHQVDLVLTDQKEILVTQVILAHVEEKENALPLLDLQVIRDKKETKEKR